MSYDSRDIAGFNKEVSQMLESKVKVQLKHADEFFITGTLKGFSRNKESIILVDAADTVGNKYTKIVIHGEDWLTIVTEETPFPMEGLYTRLKNVFPPGQVKYMSDIGAITVMGKINVNASGVTGDGPLFERVKKIYQNYADGLDE